MRIPEFIQQGLGNLDRLIRRPPPKPPEPVRNLLEGVKEGIRDLFDGKPSGPAPAVPAGYAHPIRASELPPPGEGLRVVTYNAAQGAKADAYRTSENRADQARLLNELQPGVVAFQEVDEGLTRSGNVNTALDTVRRLNPAMASFLGDDVNTLALTGPLSAHGPAGDVVLRGADGTSVRNSGQGALINAMGLDAAHRPVKGDREGSYGVATYVAPPFELTEAYTYSLPRTDAPLPGGELDRIRGLADGEVSAAERSALSSANDARRTAPTGDEARSALVTRVRDPRTPDAPERSIINVHLSLDAKVRDRQLEVLSELVRSEANASPPREVVLLGDFNAQPVEVNDVMEAAGLRRAVGSPNAPADQSGTKNIDLVWVSQGTETEASAQVKTEGTTDHHHAGTTTLR